MFLFEDDICLCGNAENCPKKETCRRAKSHGPGIYSYAAFYKENEECEDYWEIKEEKR